MEERRPAGQSAPGPDAVPADRGGAGPPSRAARLVDLVVVVLVALLGHVEALRRTEYTIDDVELVQNDPRLVLRGWDDAWALVTTSYWGDLFPGERLWRPVVRASLGVDRTIFGHDPDVYHRTNLALHALTSALVLAFVARLVPGRRGPLLAACAFALHPVHAEAVAGIVGRAEVMALLFALAGTHLHLRARRAPGAGGTLLRAVPAAACFFLGFGSKEIALTGPFLVVLVELALRGPGRPRARDLPRLVAPYLAHAAAIGAYFWARGAVLGEQLPLEQAQTIGTLALPVRCLVAAETIRDSAAALLVPKATSAYYPFTPPTFDLRVQLTLALHLALGGWALWGLAMGARPTRALAAATLGFYLSLGPVSNIIPIGVVRADRLLYTPSAWGCVLLAGAAHLVLSRPGQPARRLGWALAALALFPLARQNMVNVRAWTHERPLRESTYRRFPDSPIAAHMWAAQLVEDGQTAAGLQLLLQSVPKIPPTVRYAGTARSSLGLALLRLGRGREALNVLLEGAGGPPNQSLLHTLSRVALDLSATQADPIERGRLLALADKAGRDGTRAFPSSYTLWLQWGTVLSNIDGRERDAVAALDQAVLRRSEPWEALFNRARLRRFLREWEGALDDLRRCSAILVEQRARGPLSPNALDVEALALHERGELAAALGHAEEAAECARALRALRGS